MANVKLYHVTNPLLNVNFSLHLPRNRNLSVVTAATLRAGVSFFVQAARERGSKEIKFANDSELNNSAETTLCREETSARNIPDRCIADCKKKNRNRKKFTITIYRKLLLATYLIDVSQTVSSLLFFFARLLHAKPKRWLRYLMDCKKKGGLQAV